MSQSQSREPDSIFPAPRITAEIASLFQTVKDVRTTAGGDAESAADLGICKPAATPFNALQDQEGAVQGIGRDTLLSRQGSGVSACARIRNDGYRLGRRGMEFQLHRACSLCTETCLPCESFVTNTSLPVTNNGSEISRTSVRGACERPDCAQGLFGITSQLIEAILDLACRGGYRIVSKSSAFLGGSRNHRQDVRDFQARPENKDPQLDSRRWSVSQRRK